MRLLNLNTYKSHALGDYVSTIQHVGTTDAYSTQRVCSILLFFSILSDVIPQCELEHRTSKSRYSRTNGKNFIRQISDIERRHAHIRAIRNKISSKHIPTDPVDGDVRTRYNIGLTQNCPISIGAFLRSNAGDPALKVSVYRVRFSSVLNRKVF